MNKLSLSVPGGYTFDPVLKGGSKLPNSGLTDFQKILKWGTTMLIISAIILTIIFLILGGIEWITSGGDKEKLAKAQKKIVFASIGLVITLSAFMIVNVVGEYFGVTFF